MKILAMDTSGQAAAFAALQLEEENARVFGYAELDNMRSLSSQIILRLESVLQMAGWQLDEVDALAVSLGPGSWTGLRIGLTTAKTLAQSLGLPLTGVPVFDALAQSVWRRAHEHSPTKQYSLSEHALLLTVAPCRPGEVYGKLFECHPDYLSIVQSEWIGTPAMMAGTLATEALSREIEATAIVSSAAAPVENDFESDMILLPNVHLEAIASEIALAGAAMIEAGEDADPLTLTPLYLAPSAAERNLFAASKS